MRGNYKNGMPSKTCSKGLQMMAKHSIPVCPLSFALLSMSWHLTLKGTIASAEPGRYEYIFEFCL